MVFTSRLFFAYKPGHHAFSSFRREVHIFPCRRRITIYLFFLSGNQRADMKKSKLRLRPGFKLTCLSPNSTRWHVVVEDVGFLSTSYSTACGSLKSEEKDALLEEGGQSEFDPTERILSEETNHESGELPYEDLFDDKEGCGPRVNKGVAKRVNSACTKRLAKEQFSSIQKKYLPSENLRFSQIPRVRESWVMGRLASQDKKP